MKKYKTYDNRNHVSGIDIELIYYGKSGQLSKFNNLDFIQNVFTDRPQTDMPSQEQYNDYDRTDATSNPPFYFAGSERSELQSLDYSYGGKYFKDSPHRYSGDKNYFFIAELSVVGKRGNSWTPIATFLYGFINFNGVTIPLPFTPMPSPSNYQKTLIQQAK